MGDDSENFGSWPETHKYSWGRRIEVSGWVEEFQAPWSTTKNGYIWHCWESMRVPIQLSGESISLPPRI